MHMCCIPLHSPNLIKPMLEKGSWHSPLGGITTPFLLEQQDCVQDDSLFPSAVVRRAPLARDSHSPSQLISHRGQRLVVSGHIQSLKLTGLGKSIPLICQQHPSLNYKRRVYSAHTKGTPRVNSLGDGGDCATGP